MRDEAERRYNGVAKTLHWLIAALILANIGLAWNMGGPRTGASYAVFQLHKSIGITVLLLTIVRIGWRIANPPPPLSPHLARWEKGLAHATHYGFYLLMLGLPLTGWLMVSTSKTGIPTLLYGTIPWPNLPIGGGAKAAAHEIGERGHGLLAWLAYALILLHVAGALKHQWIDRDGEAGRMLPGPRRSGPLDWRLGAALLAFVAICVAVKTYSTHGRGDAAPAPAARAPAEPASPERTPAAAVEPAPPARVVAAEAPVVVQPSGRWIVDKARSSLGFRAMWNGSPVDGTFKGWNAEIVFDPQALDRSSVTATVDLASVGSDNGDAAGALPGSDFLDSATHPQATFKATKFAKLAGDGYEARGTLTLRGVSKPLTLRFTPGIAGDAAAMSGTATIARTLWGVGQGEWKATDQIADAVAVTVKIRAKRAPA